MGMDCRQAESPTLCVHTYSYFTTCAHISIKQKYFILNDTAQYVNHFKLDSGDSYITFATLVKDN